MHTLLYVAGLVILFVCAFVIGEDHPTFGEYRVFGCIAGLGAIGLGYLMGSGKLIKPDETPSGLPESSGEVDLPLVSDE